MTHCGESSGLRSCNTLFVASEEMRVAKVRVVRDPAPEPAKVRKAVDQAIQKADERIAAIVRDAAQSNS
jgi:hypothetical protein